MQTSIDEGRLKQVFKEALFEMFNERKNMFQDLIAEVIEEIALSRAIREGEATENINKDEIFNILEGRA